MQRALIFDTPEKQVLHYILSETLFYHDTKNEYPANMSQEDFYRIVKELKEAFKQS